MAFTITITAEAESHLLSLPAHEQRRLEEAIRSRLVHQPTTETRAVKRLRPNPLAQYELRAGDLRVLYNVDESEVVLLVVGRKLGNRLIVKGQEFHGHEDNPPKPAGEGRGGDVESVRGLGGDSGNRTAGSPAGGDPPGGDGG